MLKNTQTGVPWKNRPNRQEPKYTDEKGNEYPGIKRLYQKLKFRRAQK